MDRDATGGTLRGRVNDSCPPRCYRTTGHATTRLGPLNQTVLGRQPRDRALSNPQVHHPAAGTSTTTSYPRCHTPPGQPPGGVLFASPCCHDASNRGIALPGDGACGPRCQLPHHAPTALLRVPSITHAKARTASHRLRARSAADTIARKGDATMGDSTMGQTIASLQHAPDAAAVRRASLAAPTASAIVSFCCAPVAKTLSEHVCSSSRMIATCAR